MRALRLLALAATLVVPAAAAHAQVGVYVGPSVGYAAPAYGPAAYYPPAYWHHRIYERPYVAGPYIGIGIGPRYYGYHNEWRGYHGYTHDGRYGYGRRW